MDLAPDALLKAAAAVVGAVLAILVVSTTPRDRAARWLGVFFGLIALNQGAEFVRAIASDETIPFRIASIAASLDPVALWLFAHALLGRRPRGYQLWSVVGVAAALAMLSGWTLAPPDPTPATHVVSLLLALFTAVVYGHVAVMALRALAGAPNQASWRALSIALTLVAVPQAVQIIEQSSFFVATFPPASIRLMTAILPVIGFIFVVAAAAHVRGDPVVRATYTLAISLALAFLIVARSFDLTAAVTGIPDEDLDPRFAIPGRAGASIRWLVFGALVSSAVFGHRATGASMPARRRAARAFIGLSFLVIAAIALSLLRSDIRWTVAILLVAIVLSQAFQRLVDSVASRMFGVPTKGDEDSALEMYARAVREASLAGRANDTELDTLRRDLGIDQASAHLVERTSIGPDGPMRPGTLLAGRYHLERFVGRGGSGRVFLARDRLLSRNVVVKETNAALREARAGSRVAHPHVVAVYDVIPREDGALLVTEYVEGGTLGDRVSSQGRIQGADGARLALEVVGAIAALHDHDLVHGDLKPANVLLDITGRAKLADFGLARSTADTATLEPPARGGGTPGYLAPEVLQGGVPDARSDIFAAGLLLQRCFELPELEAVLLRAVAPLPADRPADGRALLAQMKDALSANTREGSARRR